MALVTVQRSPSSNNSPSHEGLSGFQDEVDTNKNPKSLSECYFAGKGTALVLPDADATSKAAGNGSGGGTAGGNPTTNGQTNGATGNGVNSQGSSTIQKHLQSMFYLLRPEETLKMAVKLESVHPTRTRYLVVVSRMGARGEESCLLGIDCNERTTVGLVLRVLANTQITLDGDGGFSISVCDRHHIFKPVSVQAMWSTLQTLHKVSAKAREQNYFQGGLTHSWVEYYENRIESDRSCLNEWHAMDNLESKRPPSPDSVRTKPTERQQAEKVIRATLKEIMMTVDLDEVTSKAIRTRLEEELDMDLGEYKSFIDEEMLIILGQMDAPTEIFDHVYLGSEWNASNYEELQRNGVGHILNVTREIDNFFPGTFDYLNVRVYDDEKTDLLKHWDDTYKYITKVRDQGSKVLVHCKMGVSRSASVVIAYAMKAYNWDFDTALKHVKHKRSCIKPNTSFLLQLETYQGILDAMKNREKLQRSKSETNLKSPGSNGKSEKVAGNEPAPVAQPLSKSYNIESTMSGQELRNMGSRPKSWSPDNILTREMVEAAKSPLSISLEDVSQKSASKESMKAIESKSSLARHVLMPCDNGETYSVSPNQIVHLPDTNFRNEKKNLVLDLASQFERAEQQNSGEELVKSKVKTETWDPGEEMDSKTSCCEHSSETCDESNFSVISENQTVWTSSTVVKTESAVPVSCSNSLVKISDSSKAKTSHREISDPFSNQLDRVFDREEKKQLRMSTVPVISSPELSNDDKIHRESPSRQSSWSSYDSAVALGFQNEASELSRHSSWGSGDTRTLPSRNSSWGSYDMQPRGPVHYINEKGEKVTHSNSDSIENGFPFDKDHGQWQTGTVKRSKQRYLESSSRKPSSSGDSRTSSCFSLAKTPSSETLLDDVDVDVAEAFNKILVDDSIVSSAISDKIDIPKDEHKMPAVRSRLSRSAPEPSSMELIAQGESLSRSASNVSKENSNSVISTAQCSSVKQHRTFLENLHNSHDFSNVTKKDDLLDSANASGKVKNLKKEFEAKSSTNTDQIDVPENLCKNKVSSLPSSPLSVHVAKDKKPENKNSSSDDINLKSLIGIFENNVDGVQVNRRQKFANARPFSQNRNGRYSCIEVSVDKTPRIVPLISNLNRNGSVVDKSDDKRPPIVPVVRTASPGLMVAATVITAAKKKQQQYGKSHPLARLNIKPRHNNTLYNTM
ncbi:protein phosphatase Slingshot isoform X2 [Diabrotica undecimpunctata]|uniref:protein phosphatase Slingshot isoform X2 n=1 Tax=Diabrotica undecimpunctata TaxID=50387 RepID=UPI003B632940